MSKFWLVALDASRRKQLFNPLRDSIKKILSQYWRTESLERVRLYQIFRRLFVFLLSSGGKGLWMSLAPKE